MSQDEPRTPQLALSIAVAGKRDISAAALPGLEAALTQVFDMLAVRVAELRTRAAEGGDLHSRFCGRLPARLTLITGLADGTDQIAGDLYTRAGAQSPDVERVLGAVLPCTRADFVDNSKVDDRKTFDRLAALCEFIIVLDGAMPPRPASGAPGEKDVRQKRADAFQSQSEFLLRQADLLIAVDQPDDVGRVGGTRQTVNTAVGRGTPVVLIQLGHDGIAILHSQADFDEPVTLSGTEAAAAMVLLVDSIIGIPKAPRDPAYVASLLEEFYAPTVRKRDLRNHIWNWFENRFSSGKGLRPAMQRPHYKVYRDRASDLSRLYAGHYRGAFLLGYALAVLAVTLAVLSLGLLLGFSVAGEMSLGVWFVVLVLGLLKLTILVAIARLASRAKHGHLAHRAADYRYLSERLRAMMYLPLAGSLRPPLPWSLPYTTRVAAQGVMDQLFLSIVRQPRPLAALKSEVDSPMIILDAAAALNMIRDDWLAGQQDYHRRNQQTLSNMSTWLEHMGRRLNIAVIGAVLLDLLILVLGKAIELHGKTLEPFGLIASLSFVFLAAVLPAAVASLNGIRFQSECTRLADRSEQMAFELTRLVARSNAPRKARPIRLLDALRLSEDAASLTLDEVAEWSAIYGKEFVEM